MKLSKEEKEKLISELSMPWGSADLKCDGNLISLRVRRYTELTFRVMAYINGYMKGSWVSGRTPVPEQKFLRKCVRANVSAAKKAQLVKEFGKRMIAKSEYVNGSFTYYTNDWSSGKAVINHLFKVCDSISIAAEAEVEAMRAATIEDEVKGEKDERSVSLQAASV
ncbi:hypothetical protein GTP58_28295 [Duganella sp. CY15W]|uniref:hypothetical protein n=1 Tax=Duganella sp. CY15W TaxID=2692172 RepID=UPI00136939BF|nr:hypothetical protein [Duganella sp. CY15W]MYM32239.1 hypothetical protein [Duganella sp. CY15W]